MAATTDPLEKASSLMVEACSLDNHPMHYHNELRVSEDNNYPATNFSSPELSSLKLKRIPPELHQRMKELQCSCQMGLFEEIGRAWLSIDNEIYLWAFEDSNDIAMYDGLNEVILTATIVKPKPNVFQSHISHLLVLATPLEVVLLAVSFSPPSDNDTSNTNNNYNNDKTHNYNNDKKHNYNNDLHILPEPLFSISADNIIISTIQGTSNGRIFFAGKDGRLYEIDYQGEYGWFGKRSIWKTEHSRSLPSLLVPTFVTSYLSSQDAIVQICIDESRHCLYTRSSHSNIQLFYLGRDGRGCSRIACANHHNNLHNILNLLKTSEASKLCSIKDMCCIPATQSDPQSDRLHLLAITQTGVRLYYTTTTANESHNISASTPANTLSLLHVRLPPAFLNYPSSNFSAPSFVFEQMSSVLFSQGTCLMTSGSEAEDRGDVLWVLSTDLFPLSSHASEAYDATQLVGQVWQMKQLPSKEDANALYDVLPAHHNNQGTCKHDIPALVAHEYSANNNFAIVTSLGVCVVTKASLPDRLQHLLSTCSLQSQQLHSFFTTLQEQALVSCLSLLTSKHLSHQQVSSEALKAYHLYKWTAPIHAPNIQHQTSTPMHLPTRMHQPACELKHLSSTSCNHRVLYTFLSRLLRPVWLQAIVSPVLHKNSKTTFLASRLKSEQIACVLHKVKCFKSLLQNNPSLLTPSSQPHYNPLSNIASPIHSSPAFQHTDASFVDKRHSSVKEAPEFDEAASLRQLSLLVEAAGQLLSLWSLLCEHQFHVISSKLPPEEQQRLLASTFSQLILENRDVNKSLVSGLIELYIEEHAAFDVISARLQQHCPLFYTALDQALNKGNEYVNAAKAASNGADKERLLDEALKNYRVLCSTAANSPSTTIDLSSICSRLASVCAYSGVVQLVLVAAANRDPNNLALHYYLNNKPIGDLLGEKHYRIRLDCYKCILESLKHLLSISRSGPDQHNKLEGLGDKLSRMLPSIFSSPQDTAHTQSSTCKEEAVAQMDRVLKSIVESEDRLCEFVLFTWLVDNKLSQQLLQLKSLHVEEFLKHQSKLSETGEQSAQRQQLLHQKLMLDLLARHYMHQCKFLQAANILDSLALKHGNHIDLTERLQLMTRASLCLQSCSSPAGGHLLHEVHDKVEVIMLQLEVLKEVERMPGVEQAVHLLNYQLFDVSELYTLFATPYDLSKCKLSIIRCSGHLDSQLVQSLWKQVLNKELSETAGQQVGLRIERFCSLLVSLGTNHRHSENYFPIDFLVRELEEANVLEAFCEVDVSCMSEALFKAGVDLSSLHQVYANLYQLKSSFWRKHGKAFHVVEVDAKIMRSIIDQELSVNNLMHLSSHKRRLVRRLVGSLSEYLVDLHAELTPQVPLIACLKQMHACLESLQQRCHAF